MRTIIFILLILLFASCNKKDEEPVNEKPPPKVYMKEMIEPDTSNIYQGEYYIRADFKETASSESKELVFAETTQNMWMWWSPSQPSLGMSSQGVNFSDSETDERLSVMFYFNIETDTLFTLAYADYQWANPWRNKAGMNIEYMVPVPYHSSTYLYMGGYSSDNYCQISYIGSDRINGSFHTTWCECCGGSKTFDVYGDFSIPLINASVYLTP
ncbi:MAG TPA: hypothetical protein VEP89_12045 [Draconibacterium sp.]|nr:hypothetical protein [Draconibacterium sp.]